VYTRDYLKDLITKLIDDVISFHPDNKFPYRFPFTRHMYLQAYIPPIEKDPNKSETQCSPLKRSPIHTGQRLSNRNNNTCKDERWFLIPCLVYIITASFTHDKEEKITPQTLLYRCTE
jgi:hypothetical protein